MQLCLPLTSLILYLTVHLRLDSANEPELAHFLVHGNVNSPSCHEYCTDQLHPWQGSSQTQLTAGLESDKLSWKLEWEEEEEKGFTREGEVWKDENELFSFTILSVLQTFFFFMAYFLRSHWKRYSQTFCYSNCITTISVILQNAAFDLEWPTNSLQRGLQLVQNGPITWWRTWDMMMLYINMYISIFI